MKLSTHIAELEPPIPDPQPWIDKVIAIYEKVAAEKRGRIIFVVGELGSGKTSILRSVEKAFSALKPAPHVIAGSFYNGGYQPFISDINLNSVQAVDTVGNFAAMVSKIVSPRFAAFADFAGQLLQTGASHIQFVKDHSARPPKMPETPFWLLELIRETARKKPVVCVIDDFDETQEGFGWNNFLLGLAEEITVSASILFIVSVTGKAQVGEHQDKETNLEFTTRELVNRGFAEWWYLKPLTVEEISEWIPIKTGLGIVPQLHGVTGGLPRWVQTVWRDWRAGGAVYYEDQKNRWEFSPDKKPGLNLFKSVFEDLLKLLLETSEPRLLAEAKKILGFAALEGAVFTAEALALALNLKTDDVIDYLDDYFVQTDEKPHGILREIGFIDVESAPSQTRKVFRYGFISDWHWQVLDRFTFTDEEKRKNSFEIIQALKIVYENDECPAARSLTRLCTIIGDKETARHYQIIADYSIHHDKMLDYALALLEIDTSSLNKFQCRPLAEFLYKAGYDLEDTFSYAKNLEVFEKVEILADKLSDDYLKADTLSHISKIHLNLGNIKIAKEKAALYHSISVKKGNKYREVGSLNLLGEIEHEICDFQKAIEYYNRALSISRKIENQFLEAFTLNNIGKALTRLGEYDKAIEHYRQTLAIDNKFGRKYYASIVLGNWGFVYLQLNEYEKAIEYYQLALDAQREIGNRKHESIALHHLGRTYSALGEYQKALGFFEQSLKIARDMRITLTESINLIEMGKVYVELGKNNQAIELIEQVLPVIKKINARLSVGRALTVLGEANYNLDNKEKAVVLWKAALRIFEDIKSPEAAHVEQHLEKATGK